MIPNIFVALSTFSEFDEKPLNLLQQAGFKYSLNLLGRRLIPEEIIKMAKDADGIIAGVEPYDESVLKNLPELKCISRCGAGTDNIDLKKAEKMGIAIKNTPDAVILPVAELTIAMIFDLLRKLSYHTYLMKSRKWHKEAGNLLSGKKAGVLGLGRIGKKVAETLVKLGAEVYGTDSTIDKIWAKKNDVKIVPIEFLLRNADILTIHISILENNKFILGKQEIEKMKMGSFLVNTSRGKIIDEDALYNALNSNQLGGAALDVYSKEPYDGPLCDLDNVVLTPHIATLTKESRVQMELEATQNIIGFFKLSK